MKDNITEDLIMLSKVFEKVGVQFFMQEGNALGYGRFKDIMDNDTDVDIGVVQELSPRDRRVLAKELMNEHWRNLLDSGDFLFAARRVKLNVWFYHKEGDLYVAYPESTPGEKFVWPAYFYDDLTKVDFHGFGMHLPHDLPMYLTFRYGEEWKTKHYPNSEAWKSVEEYIFKWKHRMKVTEDPASLNQRWLTHIGKNSGLTLSMPKLEQQPNSLSSVKSF